jgi:hypothetical protein
MYRCCCCCCQEKNQTLFVELDRSKSTNLLSNIKPTGFWRSVARFEKSLTILSERSLPSALVPLSVGDRHTEHYSTVKGMVGSSDKIN